MKPLINATDHIQRAIVQIRTVTDDHAQGCVCGLCEIVNHLGDAESYLLTVTRHGVKERANETAR